MRQVWHSLPLTYEKTLPDSGTILDRLNQIRKDCQGGISMDAGLRSWMTVPVV